MNRAVRLTILIALLLAVGAMAMLRRQPSPPAFGTPSPSNDYIRFIAKAKEAEAIDDNMQRCLHYPDPPGVHWQRETTDAYCSRRNLSTLSQAEVEKLLNEGNASELETAFRGYLDAQLHDPRHLGMLDAAFFNAKFHVASDRAQALTQSWKKQAPDSAFAFAASGMQYLAAAEAARGDGYARQLTADQIAGMDRLAALARKDLDRAVQLQPAMTPAYYAMIIVGSLSGDVAYMADAAQRGLAADPTSFSIHAAMMERSSPRWTGDPSTQTKLAEQIQPLTGQAPLLRLVSAQAPMEAAECNCLPNPVARLLPAADHGASMGDLRLLANVAYRNDANQLAVILYSEALRFNPVDTDSLRWRAQVLAALGDSQWAIQSIERTAKRNPENLDVALTLALAYRDAGKTVQSEAAFLALLERAPTHSKALAQLGDLYSHEAGQPDKAAAIADKLIASDANNPDGYVIRACVQMDRQLPGSYETIEYFLEHFGDRVDQANPARAMRAYLAKHPKPDYSSPR